MAKTVLPIGQERKSQAEKQSHEEEENDEEEKEQDQFNLLKALSLTSTPMHTLSHTHHGQMDKEPPNLVTLAPCS